MYATTTAAQTVVNRLEAYGVHAEGEVVTGEYHDGVDYANQMTLAEVFNGRGRVTRVRLLQERGRVDISYIHATMLDGTVVPVDLGSMPTGSHMLWRREVKAAFIAWGKAEGVYAKGLGLLDESNWSVLH